jgi:hypothetical protein
MGFGLNARQVRDESLPASHRFRALSSCVEASPPIGFNATWSYFEHRTGIERRDPLILTPALQLLEEVRQRHRRLEMDFTELRRREKAAGRRFPSRDHVSPGFPRRWHGDERTGARVALIYEFDERPARLESLLGNARGIAVIDVVRGALTSPSSEDHLDELQNHLDWSRRKRFLEPWSGLDTERTVAHGVHFYLSQLHVLMFGTQELGRQWNFSEDRRSATPPRPTARKSRDMPHRSVENTG